MTGPGPTRLGGLDSVFLSLDGPGSVGHLVLLLDLEGDLDVETAVPRLESRVPHHALLRRRLVGVPLGAGRPYWEETVPDVAAHVASGRLSEGAGLRELAAAALGLVREPLPRDRPLWRLDLLRTPSGSRTVAALTVHHAAGDGIAIRDLVSDVLDPLWDDEELVTAPEPGAPVRRLRRWAGALDLPAAAVSAAPTLAGLVPRAAGLAAAGRSEGRGSSRVLHGSVGRERSLAFGQVPLAAARALKASHGATVNDVVLAAAAGALRRLLIELGEAPRAPLHAAVPASRRDLSRPDTEGANRFGVVRCPLPVHEPAAEARLEIVRAAMRAVRERPGDGTLDTLARLAVPALATPAVRAMTGLGLGRLLPAPVDLMVSNVPMPPMSRTFAGRRVTAMRPVPLVAEGLGLNVTVHGYDDQLFCSVMSSPRVLTSTERLVELLDEEHRLLAGLGGRA